MDKQKVVQEIIEIYYQEDFEYVVKLSKQGIRPTCLNVADEVEFIKRNHLADEMTEDEIVDIAIEAIRQIDKIVSELYE